MAELVKSWARQIVTNQLSAIDGARLIVEHCAGNAAEASELAVFAVLLQDWEAGGDRRAEAERRIVEEAGMLLADTA